MLGDAIASKNAPEGQNWPLSLRSQTRTLRSLEIEITPCSPGTSTAPFTCSKAFFLQLILMLIAYDFLLRHLVSLCLCLLLKLFFTSPHQLMLLAYDFLLRHLISAAFQLVHQLRLGQPSLCSLHYRTASSTCKRDNCSIQVCVDSDWYR